MRLAVLASGFGSTFQAVAEAFQVGEIPGELVLLVTDNPEAGVIEKAEKLKITCLEIEPKNFPSKESWDETLANSLQAGGADWVLLAGFLKKLGPLTVSRFQQRMINTHPSLLPKFGGKGMYGIHVHKAVIESGEKQSGVSLHWVTENYDEGQVIDQVTVPVMPEDTPESLQGKIQAEEKKLLVATLKRLATAHEFH